MPKTTKEKIEQLKLICDHLEDLASDEDLFIDEYMLLYEITGFENHDWDSNVLAHFIDGMQLGVKEKESEVQELKVKIKDSINTLNFANQEIKNWINQFQLGAKEIEKLQKENEEYKKYKDWRCASCPKIEKLQKDLVTSQQLVSKTQSVNEELKIYIQKLSDKKQLRENKELLELMETKIRGQK